MKTRFNFSHFLILGIAVFLLLGSFAVIVITTGRDTWTMEILPDNNGLYYPSDIAVGPHKKGVYICGRSSITSASGQLVEPWVAMINQRRTVNGTNPVIMWQKKLEEIFSSGELAGTRYRICNAIKVDRLEKYLYVVGECSFLPENALSANDERKVFVAQLNVSDGRVIRYAILGRRGSGFYKNDIAIDNMGNVYIAGCRRIASIDYAYWAKYVPIDGGFNLEWFRTNLRRSWVRAILLHPNGNMYFTGQSKEGNLLVVRADNMGNIEGFFTYGDNTYTTAYGNDIECDINNNLLVSGIGFDGVLNENLVLRLEPDPIVLFASERHTPGPAAADRSGFYNSITPLSDGGYSLIGQKNMGGLYTNVGDYDNDIYIITSRDSFSWERNIHYNPRRLPAPISYPWNYNDGNAITTDREGYIYMCGFIRVYGGPLVAGSRQYWGGACYGIIQKYSPYGETNA